MYYILVATIAIVVGYKLGVWRTRIGWGKDIATFDRLLEKRDTEIAALKANFKDVELDGNGTAHFVTLDGGKKYYQFDRNEDGSVEIRLETDETASAALVEQSIKEHDLRALFSRVGGML